MSKPIGRTLVEEGFITEVQLEKALRAQLIFGGHLGTCLIEQGFIEEETLGAALSRLSSVPYVGSKQMGNVPAQIIDILPRKLAEKHSVIPIALKDRTLSVAMIHPQDLTALDEISFATGYRIEAWVSPEIRIFQVLEKYYGIPRPKRYISLCHVLDQTRQLVEKEKGKNIAAAAHEVDEPAETFPETSLQAMVEPGMEYGYGRSWHEIAEEKFDLEEKGISSLQESCSESNIVAQPAQPSGVREATMKLSVAEDRSDLSAAVLSLVRTAGCSAVLFRVRGVSATIWDYCGMTPPPAAMDHVFQVTEGSIFDLLLGQEDYAGPVPQTPGNEAFLRILGRERPESVLLMPGYMDSRLVTLLYVETESRQNLPADMENYRTVLKGLGQAIELVLLKRRIRSLGEELPQAEIRD